MDAYLTHGLEVVIVDDLSTGRASNLNPAARFYQLDIRSPQLDEVFAAERPDFVNHHAVRRMIYISIGGAVYGEPEYLPCDERHPINPICQYGASKHTVEHYLYIYHVNYDLNYTVLRYPNVYGPRQNPHGEAGVVAIFTGKMLAHEPVVINGDGEQGRDFVYVGDGARANVLALDGPASSDIYTLGSGRGTSVNEVFAGLRAITGYARPPIHGPVKLGETRQIYLDASRARLELGWEPAVSPEAGLTATVEYFKQAEAIRALASLGSAD